MAIIGDTVGKITGGADIGGMFSGVLKGMSVLFGFVVIAMVLGAVGYWYWNSKRYSKKIIIAKKISGNYIFAGTDKARIAKIGDMGNEILYLKKLKVFRVTQGILIDRNTYLFAIDQEGNWINVGLGDINLSLGKMQYEIPSNDMRLANVSVRRLNERQFEKKNWFKENIGIVVGGMILVIIVIFMWLMASKYFTIFDSQKVILDSQQKLNEQNTEMVRVVTRLVESMDNMVKGGASFNTVAAPT